ncbi:MAG: hypothetical protein L6R00_18005 [Phycisphaerae bacterium]|nr:hypothetical protein [Phycisphaerae bacterium]
MDLNGIDARFKMGKAADGESAGLIWLHAALPGASIATPAALTFNVHRDDVTVILDEQDALRQILAPQALADIVVEDDYSYRIDFYAPANVLREASGAFRGSVLSLADASTAPQQGRQGEREQRDTRRLRDGSQREIDVTVAGCQHTGAAGVRVDAHPIVDAVRMAGFKVKRALNRECPDSRVAGDRRGNPRAVEQRLARRAVADQQAQHGLPVTAEQVKGVERVNVEAVGRRRSHDDETAARRKQVHGIAGRAV